MNKTMLLGAALAAVLSSPALAAETLVVPFTSVSTATTQQYSGTIHVVVSGTGFSLGNQINDAFYFTPSGSVSGNGFYQLGFDTNPLFAFDNSKAIVNVLGSRPAFNLASTYRFDLNLGATPKTLYFGVTDGAFGDNGGAYTIQVGVPEPATWSLMIAGFGAVGFAMRRRKAPTFA